MTSWLHVSISHPLMSLARRHPLARLLRTGPRIAIDGAVVSRSFMPVAFALTPGSHLLEVWLTWLVLPRVDHASCTITLAAGDSIVARYKGPASRGDKAVIELGGMPLPEARLVER